MTDFSPLDSALYESTPEKIAASLRYLRKADAVMAALMPLSANPQAPPAAAPAVDAETLDFARNAARMLHGFMLDTNAVGAKEAGVNLARSIKANLAAAAREGE